MGHTISVSTDDTRVVQISEFVEQSSGLEVEVSACGSMNIHQKTDCKKITIALHQLEEVISRSDSMGQPFLQVNFKDGQKILLTEQLVGFKPAQGFGLDMGRLPKVVTTPDLISVVEAIEESMRTDLGNSEEVEVLRRVFGAVLAGGEAVGFDLDCERAWLGRIAPSGQKASA